MTSVTATNVTQCIVTTLPDLTNKIYLAKAARNICIGVGIIATVSLSYQIYQQPSILNPFSNERSFNPWSEKSVWFNKDHCTSIVMGLSMAAKEVFDKVICKMETQQILRNIATKDLTQNEVGDKV